MDADGVTDLVRRARDGDQAAWHGIVDEYANLVWSVVRGFRFNDAQAGDAVQTTWLRLVEHLDAIREPARLVGWLATTARRVCLEIQRVQRRESLYDPHDDVSDAAIARTTRWEEIGPEESTLRREHEALVREALATLDKRDCLLLTLLAGPEDLSYREIGVRLGMPVGSIGPTRKRALDRLRVALEAAGMVDATM
jgi:RNA polymerase sigma factor (sigma-70 family)